MADIILHHYATSPYAEKIRLVLGHKGLAWRSVTIPNIMPKPDLVALTGAYRKTPVMQSGSDIYCDTACIARELDRRHPSPALYPAPAAEIVASWAETKMFGPAVGSVFAVEGTEVSQEFKDDRAKFSGREFNPERMKAALPYMHDQLRSGLTAIDGMLGDGRAFLFGPSASIADFAAYHPFWFVVHRLGKPVAPLVDFPRVLAWMDRVKAIGHGKPTELSSTEALEIAKRAAATPATATDALDPAGRKPGDRVSIMPDDTGRDPTVGELLSSSAQEIVIRRTDARAGTVQVHFPRLGFMVLPAR